MEVILREHVDNLGRRGEVAKVADGYARTFLLPRRISGTCAMHQRKLQTAIKRARQIALIPYVTD